jgi:colicin import membrane protein
MRILGAEMKRLLWVVCWCWAGLVWATESVETNKADDWDALRTQAQELRTQAKELKAKAQREFEVTHKTCWEKFLVSSCQEDAKQAQRDTNKEANRIDMEGLAIERRVAAHDREVKLAKKAQRLQERDLKAADRAEQIRIEDEANRLRLEQKQKKSDGS